jgi:hypothetical protein
VRKLPKGKKHLAVFDALKGYHQIELDDESRALTKLLHYEGFTSKNFEIRSIFEL